MSCKVNGSARLDLALGVPSIDRALAAARRVEHDAEKVLPGFPPPPPLAAMCHNLSRWLRVKQCHRASPGSTHRLRRTGDATELSLD